MTLEKDQSTVSTAPEASHPPTKTSLMDEKAKEAKKSEKLPAKSTEMDTSETSGGTTTATTAAASNTTKAALQGPKAMDIDATESPSTKLPLKGATEASKEDKGSPMEIEKSVPQTGTKQDAPAPAAFASTDSTPVVQNVSSLTKSANTETKTAVNPTASSVAKTAVASTAAPATTATSVQVAPSANTNPSTATAAATVVTAAANRSVQQPKKKRKLNGENEEYKAVQQTVRDLIGLLQAYGPLTQGQIEYNLPPSSWPLQDILELLVALGIVQQVAPANHAVPTNSDADATATATTNTSTSNTEKPPDIQYCVCHGVPREETVLPDPHSLGHEIQRAHQQANNSFQRSQKLLHALQHPHEKKSTREVLRELLKEYPELTRDPVYFTAFRNCHIDVSGTAAASSTTSTTSGGRGRGRGRSNANRSLTDRRKSPKSARGAKIVTVSATTTTSASQKKTVGGIGQPVALKSPIPAAGTTTTATKSTQVVATTAPVKAAKATTEPSPASAATPKTVSAVPATASATAATAPSATAATTPVVNATEKEAKP